MTIRTKLRRRGFTIIELLAVITIIAILAGLGFGTYILVNRNAASKQTEVIVESATLHLGAYVDEGAGVLPNGEGGPGSTEPLVEILAGGPESDLDREPRIPEADYDFTGKGKIVKKIDGRWVLIDGFGNEMYYRGPNSAGLMNNVDNGFDLWSKGADNGEADESDKDDITNW